MGADSANVDELIARARRDFPPSRGYRRLHDHWLDPAFKGRYLKRLPDLTLVPADRYDEILRQRGERVPQSGADGNPGYSERGASIR